MRDRKLSDQTLTVTGAGTLVSPLCGPSYDLAAAKSSRFFPIACAALRFHPPFALLSDQHLKLTYAMNLPTFEKKGMTILERFTLVIDVGK